MITTILTVSTKPFFTDDISDNDDDNDDLPKGLCLFSSNKKRSGVSERWSRRVIVWIVLRLILSLDFLHQTPKDRGTLCLSCNFHIDPRFTF